MLDEFIILSYWLVSNECVFSPILKNLRLVSAKPISITDAIIIVLHHEINNVIPAITSTLHHQNTAVDTLSWIFICFLFTWILKTVDTFAYKYNHLLPSLQKICIYLSY